MAAYEKAHIDEIASNQWPHWIPVRHHFGIETFGINLWRGRDDGTRRSPSTTIGEDGAPELYYVVDGQRDVHDRAARRSTRRPGRACGSRRLDATRAATARDPGTLVLSVGAGPPGTAYKPAGWDSHYLEGDK